MKNISSSIRLATEKDLIPVAKVHIQSWRETYPGIMPQEKMDSLSLEGCLRNWQNTFSRGETFLVAEVDGEIVGFVSGGINRANEACETGKGDACACELAAMYLLKKYHGRGIGKALFTSFAHKMQELGYQSMVAWVAEKNPATGFYEAMQGEYADRKFLDIYGYQIPVVAYVYQLKSKACFG